MMKTTLGLITAAALLTMSGAAFAESKIVDALGRRPLLLR